MRLLSKYFCVLSPMNWRKSVRAVVPLSLSLCVSIPPRQKKNSGAISPGTANLLLPPLLRFAGGGGLTDPEIAHTHAHVSLARAVINITEGIDFLYDTREKGQ